ncbi:ribonuclease H-like protein [Mollisia scopiformis]|uniref:ribonuclease H n=1 Tax=Mollisia scopiformis TaxID=149040 RepID=A0A132BBA7_MOLSC|nr:ribonuclease H-like protein [Mollisia scopiformis]KUJ09124.1 ribonuclease H-like protein [Mollisia scopiformis]
MTTSNDNARLFEPGHLRNGPRSAMKYYPASGLTFAKSETPSSPSTTVIVGVDGACPDNGNGPARGSWGIYFGRNSLYNTCGLIPETEKKTNNVAEIYAAISAVRLVSQKVVLGTREVKQLVIMSDSTWLVNSMTIWLQNWKQNGFQSSKKKPVINSELIRELDDLIEDVETTLGLNVKFWHVKRKSNFGADRLANIALDNDADWEAFWRNQLEFDPKSLNLDFFTLRTNTVVTMGPRLLCLEYPVTGKGEWFSSLRAFLILQNSWKVSCLPGRTPESKDLLRDEILKGFLGPNFRRRANLELEKHKQKSDAQMALLLNAAKKYHEDGDERKGKFVMLAEINNHMIMTIVSRSLEVSLPFAECNESFVNRAKQYLSDDDDVIKKLEVLISGTTKQAKRQGKKQGRKTRQVPKPNEIDSGAKLDWGDDWVEVERPEEHLT